MNFLKYTKSLENKNHKSIYKPLLKQPQMECVICLNNSKMVTQYECKHQICNHCGTRLLFLYKNSSCPLCKQTSNKLYFKELSCNDNFVTEEKNESEFLLNKSKDTELKNNQNFTKTNVNKLLENCRLSNVNKLSENNKRCNLNNLSEKNDIKSTNNNITHTNISTTITENNAIYENTKCKDTTKNLLLHKCKKCNLVCKDTFILRAHYRELHANLLCYECTDNKKQFWFEYVLYDINTLRNHKQGKLNEDGFKGHVWCKFCKKYFYDEATAKHHCNQIHYLCSVCDILGHRNRYYKDFNDLEIHFKNFHYCCKQEFCVKIKAYAFPYKTELFEHLFKFHKIQIKLQDIKSLNEIDNGFMDPTYLSYQNNIKTSIVNRSTMNGVGGSFIGDVATSVNRSLNLSNGKSYISNSPTNRNSTTFINRTTNNTRNAQIQQNENFPDFLDRAHINKIRQEQLKRKSIIMRLKIKNHDEVCEIIEKIINRSLTIQEGVDDLKLLIDGTSILKLFKDLHFEDMQQEINNYYKFLENQILFPKFESKEKVKSNFRREDNRRVGFKIFDLKKSKK